MVLRYIFYKDGTMYYDLLSHHGLTWNKVNMVNCSYAFKETIEFLKKYDLKPTIYNVANYQRFGKIVLPDPIAKRVIEEHDLLVISHVKLGENKA